MNPKRLLDTFLDLVKLPSPSRHERPAANYVRGALEALGVAVEEDGAAERVGGDCGNLIARVPGEGEPLLLAAHMDTVPLDGPVAPVIDGDLVRSSGDTILGADDKTAVAALIELARSLAADGRAHRPLELVFTVCEEVELLGAKALDCTRLAARTGYAVDGAEPERVIRGAPSKYGFTVTVRGRGGHATRPADTINPIRAAADAVARMPMGQIDFETTANVGIFRAGSAVNVVPESAYLEVEVRSHDEGKLEFYAEQISLCLRQACAAARLQTETGAAKAEADIERTRCYTRFRLEEEDDVVQRAIAAIAAVGLKPRTAIGAGGYDGNIFNANGIRVATLGAGAHSPHTVREYANVNELTRAAEVLLRLAKG